MNLRNIFTLTLLVTVPCLANINLFIGKLTPESIYTPYSSWIQLDEQFSRLLDCDENQCIQVKLVSQTEKDARIDFTLYRKDANDQLMVVSNPQLVLSFKEGAITELGFGDTDGNIERFIFQAVKTS